MSGLLKKCLLRRNVAARVCRNLVQISLGVSRQGDVGWLSMAGSVIGENDGPAAFPKRWAPWKAGIFLFENGQFVVSTC